MSEDAGCAGSDHIQQESDLVRQQFEMAVEQTAHAVYITDTEGRIEYVNPAFERVTGYDAADVIGEPTSLLQSGDHDDEWYADLWETVLSGEQWQREMVDTRADGERVVLDQTISPVTTDDGEIERFVAVARDVTERRGHEDQISTQRDDLDLLNQVLRHDVRNHLQLVTAYADLLGDHVDDEGEEYLRIVRESAEDAVALTTAAKEMAEVMLGTATENGPVHLPAAIRAETDEIRSAYPEATFHVQEDLPAVDVSADSMLRSVFRNLLKNAVQHSDRAAPTVWVSAETDGDAVTVRVADDGPGVPEGQRAEIFGKGERGLDSPGSGIGLFLVQKLVEGYDGTVWVEDNDPAGAVFVVELPVAR